MDITISGRNTDIPERFREYVSEKTEAKVTQLAERAQAVEIKLKRRTDRQGNLLDQGKVEITLIGPGPVIRAEAEAGDKYAAFDLAIDKLVERLRRAKDKRKVHRGLRRPTALHEAAAEGFASAAVEPVPVEALTGSIPVVEDAAEGEADGGAADYTPVVIREKVFAPKRLTPSEAVDHMELLGHDFFLFLEAETGRPAVVYRRKGWDYGVIALDENAPESPSDQA